MNYDQQWDEIIEKAVNELKDAPDSYGVCCVLEYKLGSEQWWDLLPLAFKYYCHKLEKIDVTSLYWLGEVSESTLEYRLSMLDKFSTWIKDNNYHLFYTNALSELVQEYDRE